MWTRKAASSAFPVRPLKARRYRVGFGIRRHGCHLDVPVLFPMEYRIVDYEEGVRQPLHYYLAELQKRGYVFGTDYLPWDGGLKALGTGKSIDEQMKAAGRTVKVAPRLPVTDGINAARTIFPLLVR